MHKFR